MVAGRAGGGGGGFEFNTYLFTAGPTQIYTSQPFSLHCNKKFIHAAGDHHGSRQNIRPYRTLRPWPVLMSTAWSMPTSAASESQSFCTTIFAWMWGGGEINEMCDSKHTMPSEMRGGEGGGGRAKRWQLLFKKDFEPCLTEIWKKKFSEWHFCKFCPTPQIGGFLREFC